MTLIFIILFLLTLYFFYLACDDFDDLYEDDYYDYGCDE